MPFSMNPNQSNFEKIISLAKNNKIDDLANFYQNIKSFNFNYLMETPIERLAYEGFDDAVKLLLQDFNGSINAAVCGYARAKKYSEVENLVRSGADIFDAIKGYALAGDKSAVNNLLQRGAGIVSAVSGYAMTGNEEAFMPFLIKDNKLCYENSTSSLLPAVIQGLAFGNHKDIIDKITSDKRIVFSEQDRILVVKPNLLCGYAAANNQQALGTWKQDYPQFRLKFSLCVLWGYAHGGHLNEILELLVDLNDYTSTIYPKLIQWLSECGQTTFVNDFLDMHLIDLVNNEENDRLIMSAIKGYIHKSDDLNVKNLCSMYAIKRSRLLIPYLLMDNYKKVEEILQEDPTQLTLSEFRVVLNQMNHNQTDQYPNEYFSVEKIPRRLFRNLCQMHNEELRNEVIKSKIHNLKRQQTYCKNSNTISLNMRHHLSFEEASDALFIKSIKRYALDANQLRIWNTNKHLYAALFIQVLPQISERAKEEKIFLLISIFLLPKVLNSDEEINGNKFFQSKNMSSSGIAEFSTNIRSMRYRLWNKPLSQSNFELSKDVPNQALRN